MNGNTDLRVIDESAYVFSPSGKELGLSKVDRYKWNTNVGGQGEELEVDKDEIHLDRSYQRSPKPSRVNNIAKNWQWEAFQRIVVVMRENGDFFCVDGQHRLLAAKKRADISLLPCLAYKSQGIDHEAYLFLLLNGSEGAGRGPMTAFEKLQAEIITGDKTAIAIKKACDELGIEIKKGGTRSSGTVACVKALKKGWDMNPRIATRALSLALQICIDGPIHETIFTGLFHLLRAFETSGKDPGKYEKEILRLGFARINDNMQKMKIVRGYLKDKTKAEGILAALNYRRKNKIKLEGF